MRKVLIIRRMKTFLVALLASATLSAHAATAADSLVSGKDYHSYADTTAFAE